MFDRVKVVRSDDMGRQVIEWYGSKDEPASLDSVARRMLEDYPHGVIEIRYVR